MAGAVSDWVDLPTMRDQLRIAEGLVDTQLDVRVMDAVEGAAATIAEYVGQPLIDTVYTVDVVPTLHYADLGKIKYPKSVESVTYWTADDSDSPRPKSTNTIQVEQVELYKPPYTIAGPNVGKAKVYWLIQPDAGWPSEVTCLRVQVLTGMDPVEHQQIRQAIVLLARQLFDGHTQPLNNTRPNWQALLDNSGYWNAPVAGPY